jgi:hypothetical protein
MPVITANVFLGSDALILVRQAAGLLTIKLSLDLL